jgi:hypothetical protein
MSHVGSSIESLFVAGASTSESPKTPMALFATSVVDTVALASVPLFVAVVALVAAAGAVVGAGVGVRLAESLAIRFGAPATITVCGCGVVSGCE